MLYPPTVPLVFPTNSKRCQWRKSISICEQDALVEVVVQRVDLNRMPTVLVLVSTLMEAQTQITARETQLEFMEIQII